MGYPASVSSGLGPIWAFYRITLVWPSFILIIPASPPRPVSNTQQGAMKRVLNWELEGGDKSLLRFTSVKLEKWSTKLHPSLTFSVSLTLIFCVKTPFERWVLICKRDIQNVKPGLPQSATVKTANANKLLPNVNSNKPSGVINPIDSYSFLLLPSEKNTNSLLHPLYK